MVTDGKGRPLGLVLTGGNAAGTSFMQTVLGVVRVHDGRPGRPRTRPDRVLPNKAYTAKAAPGCLAARGIRVNHPRTRGPEGEPGSSRCGRRPAAHLHVGQPGRTPALADQS